MDTDESGRRDGGAIRGPPQAVPNKTLAWGARRRHRGKKHPAPATHRHTRTKQASTATAAQDKEN
jgi:hypothetical protein